MILDKLVSRKKIYLYAFFTTSKQYLIIYIYRLKVGNNDTVDAFVMKKCWERIDGEGPENYYMNIE